MGCCFFNDTATTEIYTLSLHDALPISGRGRGLAGGRLRAGAVRGDGDLEQRDAVPRDAAQARGGRGRDAGRGAAGRDLPADRKSTRLNSSHANISYAVFCLQQKTNKDS